MPSQFDIFMTRIETQSARESAASNPISHQNGARRNKADAKPVRAGQPLAEKDSAKHRNEHDA